MTPLVAFGVVQELAGLRARPRLVAGAAEVGAELARQREAADRAKSWSWWTLPIRVPKGADLARYRP